VNGLVALLLMGVAGEPCVEATRMRVGDTATCEGILVPDSDVRDLLTLDAEFGACTAGLNACQQARELERAAWEREIELLLAGRADPAPVHERGFGWTELFVGLGAGLLVGGAVTWGILASH
jgi:hypothetical protein